MSYKQVGNKIHPERISGAADLVFYPDHLARYRFALQWAPGSRILDICCGVGYGSFLLAAAGAKSVLGIDISEDAISSAISQPRLPNLEFQIGDATKPYPQPGTWDFVICFEGIEHVPDPKQLLRCVDQALRPGGVALISTPNADAFTGGNSQNPFHLNEMPESQFRDLMISFPWQLEFLAQLSADMIWQRPRWQRALFGLVPYNLRLAIRGKKAQGYSSFSQEVHVSKTRHAVPDPWQQTQDEYYPIPLSRAKKLMFNPPPDLILAVCRKPAA